MANWAGQLVPRVFLLCLEVIVLLGKERRVGEKWQEWQSICNPPPSQKKIGVIDTTNRPLSCPPGLNSLKLSQLREGKKKPTPKRCSAFSSGDLMRSRHPVTPHSYWKLLQKVGLSLSLPPSHQHRIVGGLSVFSSSTSSHICWAWGRREGEGGDIQSAYDGYTHTGRRGHTHATLILFNRMWRSNSQCCAHFLSLSLSRELVGFFFVCVMQHFCHLGGLVAHLWTRNEMHQ